MAAKVYFTWDSYGRTEMWISVKAFMALEARDLVSSPNKESGMAVDSTQEKNTSDTSSEESRQRCFDLEFSQSEFCAG